MNCYYNSVLVNTHEPMALMIDQNSEDWHDHIDKHNDQETSYTNQGHIYHCKKGKFGIKNRLVMSLEIRPLAAL